MGKFSVKFVKGEGKVSSKEVATNMPTPLWVKKNKNTAAFQKIVKDSWSVYLASFTEELQENYFKEAGAKLTKTTATNVSYGGRKRYRRAANMGAYGSTRGHMATISTMSGQPGFASGLYHDTMKAFLQFDGNNVEILHPMTDSKFIKVIKLAARIPHPSNIGNIGEQRGRMSLHLSKFLANELGFNPRRWTTELSVYRKGGSAYNFSLNQMNTKLARLENSRKRGKYKKRKKR